MKLLSENMRKLRLVNGLTLAQLEKGTRVSNAMLSQMENNKRPNPSMRIIKAIADFYEVKIDDLINKKVNVSLEYHWDD